MYWVCDIMTYSRLLIFSTLLLCCAFFDIPLWVGLVAFIVGALLDLDGYFARKYPYPDDMKYRWWRQGQLPEIMDEAADIFFGMCAMVFFIMKICVALGWIILGLAVIIGGTVEIVFKCGFLDDEPKQLNVLLLCRRYLYFAALGVILIFMTFKALPLHVALMAVALYISIAVILYEMGIINLERLKNGIKK